MARKIFNASVTILLVMIFSSCKTKSASKLIVGTWIPVNADGKNDDKTRVKFLANKIGVVEFKGEEPRPNDSITYEIKDKLLITTEKSGKVEQIEILELTEKKMVLSRMATDTMKLVKE